MSNTIHHEPKTEPVTIHGSIDRNSEYFSNQFDSAQSLLVRYHADVVDIGRLHAETLNVLDPASVQVHQARLDERINNIRQLQNEIRSQIVALKEWTVLQRINGSPRLVLIYSNQVDLLNRKFIEALQEHQKMERDYGAKYRTRIERQVRLVNPAATEQEVEAILDNANGVSNRIFTEALATSTRYKESNLAYRETQERHQQLQKIEQDLAEIATLMNDMSAIVQPADEQLAFVEESASQTAHDLEKGDTELSKTVDLLLLKRRRKWICFFISILLAVIIAAVVSWYFTIGPGGRR